MDKEQLLAYFRSHYLSRQEVLCKLPLDVPLDSFWPELLNRRKAAGTILPLYDGDGAPYWFTLTDRMIRASSRLSEEAMAQEPCFDPYRAEMTSAMTEEMFFTSFVEGARIRLDEAMDFLAGGAEPETIQEQMIGNNRKAWSAMVQTLYHPLDEQYIKGLAFMLTEEMDNCAEDYRKTAEHTVAAMNSEPCFLPPVSVIPARMADLYAFLARTDVHPLIKASAGQAFILVTRPFPEGNERLSRMISSAVLLRSGYDFFRDISISGAIARENFRYYKAMCDILRKENGNDLTYFMEYYLELLVRALDARRERELRHRSDTVEREREMAKCPLKPNDQPIPPPGSTTTESSKNTVKPVPASKSTGKTSAQAIPADYMRRLGPVLSACKPYPGKKERILDTLSKFLSKGIVSVTKADWAEAGNCTICKAESDLELMVRRKLAACERGRVNTYYFTLSDTERKTGRTVNDCLLPHSVNNSPPYAQDSSDSAGGCRYDRVKEVRRIIQSFIDDGIEHFDHTAWGLRSSAPTKTAAAHELHLAVNMGLVSWKSNTYTILENPENVISIDRLTEKQRNFTLSVMNVFKGGKFTQQEIINRLGLAERTVQYYIEQLTERGMLEKCETVNRQYLYRFSPAVHAVFTASGIFGSSIEFRQEQSGTSEGCSADEQAV